MTQRSTQAPPLPPLAALSAPQLTWNDTSPHSDAFDDVYFSREDGRAETEHVFLEANQLAERFAAWQTSRAFVIGETGFGTGLNMLCAWACFEQHAPEGARLHLLSTEKFPLSREALTRALSAWPSLASYSQALCALWPDAVSGIHRLHLSERVTLDLHFGDTTERLDLLDGQVDAWFLDGFAPSKNPDMWQPALFEAMAARSRPGATFATFTCAGIVKRGLKAAGFHWKKVPGFGRKREMLSGGIDTPPSDSRRSVTPWFTPPAHHDSPHVVVIGAGLAGSSVAAALAKRGKRVTVIEREAPGAGGSGNRQGALYVKLAVDTNLQSRFYLAGLLYSQRRFEQLAAATLAVVRGGATGTQRQRGHAPTALHGPSPAARLRRRSTHRHAQRAGGRGGLGLPGALLSTSGMGTAKATLRAVAATRPHHRAARRSHRADVDSGTCTVVAGHAGQRGEATGRPRGDRHGVAGEPVCPNRRAAAAAGAGPGQRANAARRHPDAG